MKNTEFKELLKKKPKLFHYYCTFNLNPASYLHPSRRALFFSGYLSDKIWEEPRVMAKLSAKILEQINCKNNYYLNYPDPHIALALLPLHRMARLATHIGAVSLGSKVRGSIAREQVMEWKDRLGAEAYDFVVSSGKLLPNFTQLRFEKSSLNVQTIGYSLIAKSLSERPQALSSRANLKLPTNLPEVSEVTINATQIVNNVMTILESEWHSLFEN